MNEQTTYIVPNAAPEAVIGRLRVWLEDRPWSTGTTVPLIGNTGTRVSVTTELKDSYSGTACIVNLVLGVITLGSWLVVAISYYLITAFTEAPSIAFEAFDGGENNTRLKLQVGKIKQARATEYLGEIDQWLRSELYAEKLSPSNDVEDGMQQRPAVGTHDTQNYGPLYLPPRAEPVPASPNVPTAPEPDSSSVPNQEIFVQIERLADLRDAGHITDEEFQQKKRELLDRI